MAARPDLMNTMELLRQWCTFPAMSTTSVCKACESSFTAADGHSLFGVVISAGCLLVFAALAMIAGSPGFALFWIVLLAVRLWLFQRSKRPQCPSCKSLDCVPAESPAGQRIIAQTRKV